MHWPIAREFYNSVPALLSPFLNWDAYVLSLSVLWLVQTVLPIQVLSVENLSTQRKTPVESIRLPILALHYPCRTLNSFKICFVGSLEIDQIEPVYCDPI